MLRPASWPLAATALALVCACNGPKDNCEGSAHSFYSLLAGHDWNTMHEMITPEFKRKFPDVDRFEKGMEAIWQGAKSFSVHWNAIAETKEQVCIANGTMSYTVKIRGKDPREVSNEYFSWTFRKGNDGLWYAELPGLERISGY